MEIPELDFKDFLIKNASSSKGIDELLNSINKASSKGSVVQIFDSKSIVSRLHVMAAYANALIAFKNKTNKTKSVAMEMLLFAAMTDQIESAIEIAGAKNNSNFVIFADKKTDIKMTGIKINSDFKPLISHSIKVASSFGIKEKKIDRINAHILQKMSVSRL